MNRSGRRWRWVLPALLLTLAITVAGIGSARWALWPPAPAGFDQGPVVVLGGGGGQRLDAGMRMLAAGDRPLVVTGDAVDLWIRRGRSCDTGEVTCVLPVPWSTAGEAVAVADLAEQDDWTEATVVTSDFHAPRARLLMERCLDVPVQVVGVPTDPAVVERIWRWARESVATSIALVRDPCR